MACTDGQYVVPAQHDRQKRLQAGPHRRAQGFGRTAACTHALVHTFSFSVSYFLFFFLTRSRRMRSCHFHRQASPHPHPSRSRVFFLSFFDSHLFVISSLDADIEMSTSPHIAAGGLRAVCDARPARHGRRAGPRQERPVPIHRSHVLH